MVPPQDIDTARTQAVSRQHEASELLQRGAAVDVQRACVQQEYDVCLATLQRLHALCEEHAAELKAKAAQQQQAQQQLDGLGADVAAAEAHMASQLAQMQQVHIELHAAREEAAALKAAHVQRLRETHLSSRTLAPLRSELAQLRAEVAESTRQLEAPRLDSEPLDGSVAERHELLQQIDAARLAGQRLQDEVRAGCPPRPHARPNAPTPQCPGAPTPQCPGAPPWRPVRLTWLSHALSRLPRCRCTRRRRRS